MPSADPHLSTAVKNVDLLFNHSSGNCQTFLASPDPTRTTTGIGPLNLAFHQSRSLQSESMSNEQLVDQCQCVHVIVLEPVPGVASLIFNMCLKAVDVYVIRSPRYQCVPANVLETIQRVASSIFNMGLRI